MRGFETAPLKLSLTRSNLKGHPKTPEKGIGQQINTNQSVNINFIIDSLKEELKGKEINELKEAYSKGKTPEEKKNNVVEKLKKF